MITYGNFSSKTGYISTENIFTVPQKKGLTKPLFSYLEDLGFHLETGEQFSTRVCSPCGTKVRAAAAAVYLLKNNLNQPAPSTSIPNELNDRSKRMSDAAKENTSNFKPSEKICSEEIALLTTKIMEVKFNSQNANHNHSN